MTDRMENEDIRTIPIRWKVPGAGFVGSGAFAALVDRDPDPFPCVVYGGPEEGRDAHERTCRETWATVWLLEGDTLEKARRALAESCFLGAAYHLSDCQLLDDRPAEDAL